MLKEKTITICGKEVRMCYCAATEIGYEGLSNKSISVFTPTPIDWDAEGKPVKFDPPAATTEDYIMLALSAIIAAYAKDNEQAPITDADIMYDATPQEVSELLKTVAILRMEWYKVPDVVKPEFKPDGKKPKNA